MKDSIAATILCLGAALIYILIVSFAKHRANEDNEKPVKTYVECKNTLNEIEV